MIVNETMKHTNFVIILPLLPLSSRSEQAISNHPLLLVEAYVAIYPQ